MLDVPYWQLDWHIRRSPSARRYHLFELPKRGGGHRQIASPIAGLKAIQTKLSAVLSGVYRAPKCVHGFVHDRGILTNAIRHAARAWVLNVDIESFFPSITFPRVRGMFLRPPYSLPVQVATVLAQICCTPNSPASASALTVGTGTTGTAGGLAQGAPTSPIVANMICARLDGQLVALARKHRVTYTRYADDLTFSTGRLSFPPALGSRDPVSGISKAGSELFDVVAANGFAINEKKSRLQRHSSRQVVTGLVVNHVPNVHRTAVREVRAMLHAWRKHGEIKAEAEHRIKYRKTHRSPSLNPLSFRAVVRGKIEFIRMVRGLGDPIGNALLDDYRKILGLPVSTVPTRHDRIRNMIWVLEAVDQSTTEVTIGTGVSVAGLGILTCAHAVTKDTELFQVERTSSRYRARTIYSCGRRDLALLEQPLDIKSGVVLERTPGICPIGSRAMAIGFPNYNVGDNGHFLSVSVAGHRTWMGVKRCVVDVPFISGMSGGPVLNERDELVGIVQYGARGMMESRDTEMHAFIAAQEIEAFLREARAI